MARYIGPSCKLCRAAGTKLFLKGDRCTTSKCAIERRNKKPGPNRPLRPRTSEYGIQLIEKQKVKRTYGLLEAQFYNYYKKASAKKGITGNNLMQLLERRLDNVVYRSGMAKSRAQARQIVRHGHVMVDSKRVDIPSFQVSRGSVISFDGDSIKLVKENIKDRTLPEWLDGLDNGVSVTELPVKETIGSTLNEQMVVDFYSR